MSTGDMTVGLLKGERDEWKRRAVRAERRRPQLSEPQRQTVLLALAKLSLTRPGWGGLLGSIADRLDGRAEYDQAKTLGPEKTPRAAELEAATAAVRAERDRWEARAAAYRNALERVLADGELPIGVYDAAYAALVDPEGWEASYLADVREGAIEACAEFVEKVADAQPEFAMALRAVGERIRALAITEEAER